ncbi:TetR/AcrR family transcriptional regulator [Desulfohalovibrio reitneri]|uniref:TetR/AcrR family transcriptional regulator n=1 Tax=Desulfohalovibrio reitneri TaxID=1307759 RepID=UPI0004A6B3EC|nr:TetR/AcrR family transcriptional regulator [Desulfohalovibrio reitneri]
MTKQREKSRQTRRELMDAAMALFADKGFGETSVAEITARAGYAKGSFYRHFDGKDRLFLDILERKLAEYRAQRDRSIEEAADLEEALRVIWDFLATMVADRNWAKVFLEFTVHAARDEGLREELGATRYRLSEDLFARLIRPFVPEGYPARKLGALNTALFEGFMVHNALESGVLDLADVREAAVALSRTLGAAGHEEET